MRLLLQPQLYESVINDRYLKLCTEACAGVCETYKRLHDRFPVSFSTISVQTVFLAGKFFFREIQFVITPFRSPECVKCWLTYRRFNVNLLRMGVAIQYRHQKHVCVVRLQYPTVHNDRTLA